MSTVYAITAFLLRVDRKMLQEIFLSASLLLSRIIHSYVYGNETMIRATIPRDDMYVAFSMYVVDTIRMNRVPVPLSRFDYKLN